MRLSEAYRALLAFQELANQLTEDAEVNMRIARVEIAAEQRRVAQHMHEILLALHPRWRW